MKTEKPEFIGFPKIPRLSRECVITEKIDGTNAQVFITDYGDIYFGSRNRWITPSDDNYGFARWGEGNKSDLINLGPGSHFGEWWGEGIQRGYGLNEKRFSLFNTSRWQVKSEYSEESKKEVLPDCCHLVPVIAAGVFTDDLVYSSINYLIENGSQVSPGYYNPEGIIIYHSASRALFKKLIENDQKPKSKG